MLLRKNSAPSSGWYCPRKHTLEAECRLAFGFPTLSRLWPTQLFVSTLLLHCDDSDFAQCLCVSE